MIWETVIGLEVHVELSTKSKIFCSCSTTFGAPPNSQCCPVCTGLPGSLPVLNRSVVDYAAKVGLALGGTITPNTAFDRKCYFYPDLPKGYQISQLHLPISRGGSLSVGGRSIRIHELHMEEDAGRLQHDAQGVQICDFNRCGIPLIEIVTAPDLRSGEEAAAFLEELQSILRYLKVSDCKMQEGSLRCDVNLSVRPVGSELMGVRTEMKNLASLRAVKRAIRYESARQIKVLEQGGTINLETRRWDEDKERSVPMRPKESVWDYRYFPDPDLPPLNLSPQYLEQLRSELPELPQAKRERYSGQWSLPDYDCRMLAQHRALAEYFEAVVNYGAPPKQAANWILGEVLRRLAADGTGSEEIPLPPSSLARIISLVAEGKLNRNTAVTVFDAVYTSGDDIDSYVAAHGLAQVSDPSLIQDAAQRILRANQKSISDYRAGKEKAFGYLVGQIMRELRGQASPSAVHEVLHQILDKQ